MDELNKKIASLDKALESEIDKRDIKAQAKELDELRKSMLAPDFWTDSQKAQAASKREAQLARQVGPYQKLQASLADLKEMAELGDNSLQSDLSNQLMKLETELEELKQAYKFDDPYDDHDVILNFYAGAGGTDAQDWTQMLLRMYVRWAESHRLKVQTLEETAGDEAGLKSATIEISGGDNLYGQLAGEHGVHRLVRLSPYNANSKRQTSFAKVEVLPKIHEPSEVAIDDGDLKVDVFRSGGAGGQSVNTTDSAVRVTHIPTGITVSIQNERSQLQNKETAMAVLRSRLAAMQLEQHADNIKDLKGPNQANEWGSQIRSYVLHPYKQVKDTRTNYETSDAEAVLEGGLDPFIEAWLKQ